MTTTTKTKKNTKKDEVSATEVVKSSVILGARMTEKAAIGAEKGVYTFNIAKNTNKTEVRKAFIALYKVTPLKISITQRKEKVVFVRGKVGTKSGGKKAVVYLKKGDKIAIA